MRQEGHPPMSEATSPDTLQPGESGVLPPGFLFKPSKHGFHFANSFSAIRLPFTLPGKAKKSAIIYGLCGGMSFTAADFYHASKPIPDVRDVPNDRMPLYGYLLRRQGDSFGPYYRSIWKYLDWMFLPDGTVRGTQRRTRDALPGIRRSLDAGQPVVLGLVYVNGRDTLAIWQNHQVLAWGYKDISETISNLHLYDPNFPDNDYVFIRTKRVEVGRKKSKEGKNVPVYGVVCTQKVRGYADRPVRGFFPIDYSPQPPPDL